MTRAHLLLSTLLAATIARAQVPAAALPPVDFNRDVRPILADRCFRCHGPDAGARKRGLRLDTEAGSRALLESGVAAIVPGSARQSELIARIESDDEEEVMPPPELHRPLSADQKRTLARWIDAGAQYAPHWAFVPPRRGEPVADPIDHHVRARLAREGLSPAPEADRATLLRRLSLVLTGVPPTPADLTRFLADPAPDAYEREVERLLASPRIGEHLAATWLDVARYADTFGYQADWECSTWPWRDWLIEACNRDLPYDQFVRDQLAGDLLPGATREQRIATAFNRLHRMTNEGGSIAEECRQEAIADRVATAGTAFLGLTVECARCHDHKYDPISQRDFYRLGAFFGAIDEAGTYAYSHRAVPPPALPLPTPEQASELARLDANVAAATTKLGATLAQRHTAFRDWQARGAQVQVAPPIRTEPLAGSVPGPAGRGQRFDGDSGVTLADAQAFRRSDAFSLTFGMHCPDTKARAVILHTAPFTIESDPQGYQVMLDDGRLAWQIIHFWPGSAAAIRTRAPFPLGRWVQVAVTYDGSSRAAGLGIYFDGVPVATEIVRDGLDGAATARVLQIGFRDRDLGFAHGALGDLAVYDRMLTEAEIAELQQPGSGAASAALESYFTHAVDAPSKAARADLHAHRVARDQLADSVRRVMVMAPTPHPRPAHVLRRGAYDDPDPKQPVRSDGALDALLAFAPEWPRNRLGLALWMTDPRNPLLARVQVNRLWSQCFGRGLVATQENFGLQGDFPSHPELLDALALEFIAGGWSNKKMLGRIVRSATFRQSSDASKEVRARDRDNVLLARGPAFRLSAEVMRDQALAVSGLLVDQIGGPSVKPWQPEGLWEDAGVQGSYKPDTGDAAHRRSLYTFRKRAAPPPNMLIFDAGSREKCLARRMPTNTPLQALVLWNDPVFFECAQALAALGVRTGGAPREQIATMIRHATLREPWPGQVDALLELFAREAIGPTLVAATLFASDACVTSR